MSNIEKRIRLEAFITEREAMIAENQWRISRDESIAYNQDGFVNLAMQIMRLLDEQGNGEQSNDER